MRDCKAILPRVRIKKQDGQCRCKRNFEALSPKYCGRGKAISITYSECVSVALLTSMQSARSLLCCLLWPVRLYYIFPYCHLDGTIFGGKEVIQHKACVLVSLQFLYEAFLILRRIERCIVNVHRCSCEVPVILVRF